MISFSQIKVLHYSATKKYHVIIDPGQRQEEREGKCKKWIKFNKGKENSYVNIKWEGKLKEKYVCFLNIILKYKA